MKTYCGTCKTQTQGTSYCLDTAACAARAAALAARTEAFKRAAGW